MTLGLYTPSYFQTHIETEEDLISLLELPEAVQALYYHEYIHFLQNLTTTYGLTKTWNTYDRIRQLISFIQKETRPINLPLQNEVVSEQKAYWNFLYKQTGSTRLNVPRDIENQYIISQIKLIPDADIMRLIPNSPLVELTVSVDGFADETYILGETAIAESMAYLIESKFYDGGSASKYPYMVVEELIDYLKLPNLNTPEYRFALCDIALMHPMPGWALYTILTRFKTESFSPQDSKEILDRGMQIYADLGWHVLQQMENAANGLAHIINELYNHEYFEATRQWFYLIVIRGYQLRKENPYLLLDLFLEDRAFSDSLTYIWHNLGGPHCINGKNERVLKEPAGLHGTNIHPQHLLVLYQLNDFLLMGKKECRLYPICSNSYNKELVDERCLRNPWDRANDDMGCPFAAAWTLFGFHQKNITLNNKPLPEIN